MPMFFSCVVQEEKIYFINKEERKKINHTLADYHSYIIEKFNILGEYQIVNFNPFFDRFFFGNHTSKILPNKIAAKIRTLAMSKDLIKDLKPSKLKNLTLPSIPLTNQQAFDLPEPEPEPETLATKVFYQTAGDNYFRLVKSIFLQQKHLSIFDKEVTLALSNYYKKFFKPNLTNNEKRHISLWDDYGGINTSKNIFFINNDGNLQKFQP